MAASVLHDLWFYYVMKFNPFQVSFQYPPKTYRKLDFQGLYKGNIGLEWVN